MSPSFGTAVQVDVTDRVIRFLLDHTSYPQRLLLVKIKNNAYSPTPGDGVTGPMLNALKSKGLINRLDDWRAEITWLGILVALKLETEELL